MLAFFKKFIPKKHKAKALCFFMPIYKNIQVWYYIYLKLQSNLTFKADVYKTVIKFEAEQK